MIRPFHLSVILSRAKNPWHCASHPKVTWVIRTAQGDGKEIIRFISVIRGKPALS